MVKQPEQAFCAASRMNKSSHNSWLVYLILKAPDELSNIDPAIFGQFFKLAVDVKDEQVIENILWLQSALIEINSSEE